MAKPTSRINPPVLKSIGYLISTASVVLLGVAAWPGAAKAGLIPVLLGGMALSVGGMACRWWSYRVEKRLADAAAPERKAAP